MQIQAFSWIWNELTCSQEQIILLKTRWSHGTKKYSDTQEDSGEVVTGGGQKTYETLMTCRHGLILQYHKTLFSILI